MIRDLFLGGCGVFIATEVVKWLGDRKNVWWGTETRKTALKATAGLLAAAATGLSALADGNVDAPTVQNVMVSVVTFAGAWLSAFGMHKAEKRLRPPGNGNGS